MLQYHAAGFRAAGADIVAICDVNEAAAGSAAADLGVGSVFSDVADMLQKLPDLDAVSVITPNRFHKPLAVQLLQAGKHVFCEKPPGRNVEDIRRVMKAEAEHPELRLKYGFNHRYHESVVDAVEIIRSGQYGKVINMRGVYGKSKFISFGKGSDWRVDRDVAGGGILLDQGIHMVDLMRLFAGEFTEVKSFVSNGYWGHDIEDNAYALMRTDQGCVAMLHSTATQWRHRFSLEITLESAGLILSGILSGSKSYGAETLTVIYPDEDDLGDPREVTTRYNHDPSWADEIAEFCDVVGNGRKVVSGNSDDALKSMELVYRIYCADPEWRDAWQIE